MQEKDSVFFAALPSPEAAARFVRFADALCEEQGLTGARTRPDLLHISLNAVGRYDEQTIEKAKAVAATIAMKPFKIAFNSVTSFRGKPNLPLVMRGDDGVARLYELYDGLYEAMGRAGLVRFSRTFTPHVTIAYVDNVVADASAPPIDWWVTEFVLIRSLHGESRHIRLGAWPLGG